MATNDRAGEALFDMRFRAQVMGVNGWVDGGLFARRQLAEADADRLAARYGNETRIIEETQGSGL